MEAEIGRSNSFEDVVDKCSGLLCRLESCAYIKLEDYPKPKYLGEKLNELSCSSKGVYVFYEIQNGAKKPMYVGRTNNMKQRLHGHRKGPTKSGKSGATFALLLAKNDFKAERCLSCDLFGLALTRELNRSCKRKKELWTENAKRVDKMMVRVVEVQDAIEQAIFEIYAHSKLVDQQL